MKLGRISEVAATLFAGALAMGCGGGGGGGGFASTGSASTVQGATPTPITSSSGTVAAATSGAVAPLAVPARRTNPSRLVARYGEGFLELHPGGRKVLHTKGSSYERGVQYGYLVGDEVEGVLGKLPRYAAQQGGNLAAYAQSLVTPVGSLIMKPYFDADSMEELRGILVGMRLRNPGSFVQEQDLIFVNALIDIGAVVDLSMFRCSGLAVWGDISKDRKVFQTRCVDLMTGSGLEDHALVVIAKPANGVPYLNPGWAGMIGAASGLNAHGIGVSQVWGFSRDKGFGRPWVLAMRELLATGIGADDATRILQNSSRTYGSNFVFADRGDGRNGQPKGICVEITKSHVVPFECMDPREDLALWNGQQYSIKVPFAVFRGDAAMDPLLRSLQTASNGPTGDPRTSSAYRNRYKGQADGILRYVNAGVKIGADECMQITKDVSMRDNSLQCCVYANTDLEVWIANARIANGVNHDAFTEPYNNYSLDYFTPTAKIVPDQTTIGMGKRLRVAVPIETLGRERALDVKLTLEIAGTMASFGPTGVSTVVLPDRGRVTSTLDVTIPSGLPNVNLGKLVVELYEAGTQSLVDVTKTDITITP